LDGPVNPEILLVSAVVQTGALNEVIGAGVSGEYFHSQRHVWNWLEDFALAYGKAPDKSTFRSQFPDFPLLKTTDLEFAIDAVEKAHLRYQLTTTLREATTSLVDDDPEKALALVHSALTGVNYTVGSRDSHADILRDYSPILQEAERRVLSAGSLGYAGLSYGFRTINDRTGGIFPGDLVIWAARLGQGKALTNSTGVLTPRGYVPIGELTVGSRVIGSDGKATRVIGVFPQGVKQVYEVEFSDGSVIEACEDHLWNVRVGTKPFKVQTTAQVMKHTESGRQRYAVPTLSGPVQFVEQRYLFDPYKLGLLLGDGCFRGKMVQFSSADEELVEAFGDSVGYRHGYDCGIKGMKDVVERLGLWGKRSEEKFVPAAHLHGSPTQRHALLQGLLDTDGSVTGSGGVEFSTTSEQLAKDVQFLVESLGGHAHWHQRQTSFEGKDGLPSYRLIVVLPPEFPPFRLARKATLVRPRTKYQPVRTITAVRPTDRYEAMTCIAVEAVDSLFVTEHGIVTHNTWFLCKLTTEALIAGKKVVFVSLEQTRAQISFRIHTLLARELGFSIRHRDLMQGANYDVNEYRSFLVDLPNRVPGSLIISDPSRGRATPYTLASLMDRHQPDLMVIDYLTLMQQEGDDWRGARKLSADTKLVAQQYGVPIVAAAQVNRAGDGGKRPPSAKHLAESDGIGQDADVIVTQKQESTSVMQCLLAKNRSGEGGQVFWAAFQPNEGRIEEINHDEAQTLVSMDVDLDL
jgi:replicative DNA helicase